MHAATAATSTQHRIQAAALSLFARKGLAGASMAEIARQARLSAAALYRYFPSKEALFESLKRPDLDRGARRTRERQEEILRAARRVFGKHGFARTTMTQVAREVGLSKAALYEYFPSKDELFVAVIQDGEPCLLDSVEPYDDPASFLRAVGRRFLRDLSKPDQRELTRIILAEACSGSPVGKLLVERTFEPATERIVGHLVELGVPAGRELREAADAFMGLLFAWSMRYRIINPVTLRRSEMIRQEASAVDRAVDLFLHGAPGLRPSFSKPRS